MTLRLEAAAITHEVSTAHLATDPGDLADTIPLPRAPAGHLHHPGSGPPRARPAPHAGPRIGTATFDLIVRPTDIDALPDHAPDTVVTCTSGDRRITHELLNGTQPGDLLRITGTMVQPPAPGEPARLTVDALEVLDIALIPVLRDMVMDRYGDYCVIFNADHEKVPVFTALGQWVDEADHPDAIAPLIDIHARVNGGDA
ncbi:hypothetical protein [Streptomyces sp. 1222.5]|uniref:hypothetical protein n=1 Tax=Streptomyces sp. 1222.5 TaxID=1881026 RepID=UPI003D70CE0D